MRIDTAAARAMPARSVVAMPSKAGSVEVWIPSADGGSDRLAQRSGGVTSNDSVVRDAFATGQRVLDYVRREFGRNSFDGQGTALKLRVHAPDPVTGEQNSNNAFWSDDEKRIWLGDGDGEYFIPLGGADDVVAHEFFHGMIDSEIDLGYSDQEGALHESFADVLATGVDGNWQIAERVFTPRIQGDALRDLSKLEFTDWRTFPDWQDEVHAMSEVPSHAAYLVAQKIGAQSLRQIWFLAVTQHLQDHAGFAGARDATIAAAQVTFGAASTQAQAVIDAWTAVGIESTTPKERGAFGPVPVDAMFGANQVAHPIPFVPRSH